MSRTRRKESIRHLSEEDLDRLLAETDDAKISKRLTFIKRLYKGPTLADAADNVGKAPSTGSRWAKHWTEGGLGQLPPNVGAGRFPKLGEDDQDELIELLREGQPWDNSQRLYYIDDPHIIRPLVRHDKPTVGFYALNGESVVSFPDNQEKEQICACLERIREQNPSKRMLLVLDNFPSFVCEYTRKRAHQRGIDLVCLPVGSPDLNPIEPVWKSLKWEASPMIVESAEEFRALVTDLFDRLTNRLRFATS